MSNSLGRAGESVAADPGFFSAANESKAGEMGVQPGSRFQATTRRVPHANSGRSSVGLRSFRSDGAQAVKACISVSSNAAMGCGDRSTKDRTASSAGSDSG